MKPESGQSFLLKYYFILSPHISSYLQQTVDRISQVLSGLDILSREAVVSLNVGQEFVEGLEVMFGGSGQVGQGGVQLPQSGQSLVTGL